MTWWDWVRLNHRVVIWSLALFALILSMMAIGSVRAHAHSQCMVDIFGNKFDCRKHTHYRKKRTKVYGYRKATSPHARDWHCLARVRAVGSQWINAQGAKKSAVKAWREVVRFDSGEKFSDYANARDVRQGCSQSSIGEVIGKVFYRCEITATPCRHKTTSDER